MSPRLVQRFMNCAKSPLLFIHPEIIHIITLTCCLPCLRFDYAPQWPTTVACDRVRDLTGSCDLIPRHTSLPSIIGESCDSAVYIYIWEIISHQLCWLVQSLMKTGCGLTHYKFSHQQHIQTKVICAQNSAAPLSQAPAFTHPYRPRGVISQMYKAPLLMVEGQKCWA